jgi:peptidoglycan/LPS O-acetylase OafA/YrhL
LAFVATVRGYKSKQNKYLDSFNIMANMKHFNIREGEDLNVWDGVRSLAMMWVVIGHVFSFWLNVIDNITNAMYFGNKPYILILEAGILAVDVFFCLGGFFLAFIMLRNIITPKICGLGILQRALRVWPAYILTMLYFYSLHMRTGSGPSWSFQEEICLHCSNMWREIIFMSNFINTNATDMCLGWGWYLQVDFQLFVFGVFLLYLYSIKKVAMYSTITVIGILSTIFVFVYVQKNQYFVTADLSDISDD